MRLDSRKGGNKDMDAHAGSRRHCRLAGLLAISAILMPLGACNRSKNGAGAENRAPQPAAMQNLAATPGIRKTWGLRVKDQPGTVFHIEYSDRTSVVDFATVARTLKGVSQDHRIFIFEDSPELRRKLVPGNFVLFQGLDLRKVDALAVDGKNLIIGTETAPLREALKKADMQWKVPVRFDQLLAQLGGQGKVAQAPASLMGLPDYAQGFLNFIQPTVYAGFSNTEVEGEVEIPDNDFSTWKCHYHFTRQPEQQTKSVWQSPPSQFWNKVGNAVTGQGLDFDIQLEREGKGMTAGINLKGHLTDFEQVSSILMADGAFQHAYFKNVGLHGSADLDWEVASTEAQSSMKEIRFKLPTKVAIPLMEFDLPMSLEFSEALLFHPAMPTKGILAKGGFRVNYSGDEGFTLAKSDMEPEGQAESDSAIQSDYAFSPLSSFGVLVAVAFPRVELKMGTEELWEMAEVPLPQPLVDSATDLLLHHSILGQWIDQKAGNPLATEASAYFQVVISTTAAHSGMQSLVPCQQFTMTTTGMVGFDAKWLGIAMDGPSKELFKKNLVERKPDAKICGGG